MCTLNEKGIWDKYFELSPQRVLTVQLVFDGSMVRKITLGLRSYSSLARHTISPKEELIELLSGRSPYEITYLHYTPFQKKVLTEVQKIPFGATTTYAAIASAVGCSSPRPIGGALAANTTPLIIPCHRVIRTDGALGGFSQGTEIKKLLLRFEDENRCDE